MTRAEALAEARQARIVGGLSHAHYYLSEDGKAVCTVCGFSTDYGTARADVAAGSRASRQARRAFADADKRGTK